MTNMTTLPYAISQIPDILDLIGKFSGLIIKRKHNGDWYKNIRLRRQGGNLSHSFQWVPIHEPREREYATVQRLLHQITQFNSMLHIMDKNVATFGIDINGQLDEEFTDLSKRVFNQIVERSVRARQKIREIELKEDVVVDYIPLRHSEHPTLLLLGYNIFRRHSVHRGYQYYYMNV